MNLSLGKLLGRPPGPLVRRYAVGEGERRGTFLEEMEAAWGGHRGGGKRSRRRGSGPGVWNIESRRRPCSAALRPEGGAAPRSGSHGGVGALPAEGEGAGTRLYSSGQLTFCIAACEVKRRHVRPRPLRQPSGHRSDQPCPRPEDMLWGLSSAVQRCEDGGGLWGREALPADGLEQAHSEIPSLRHMQNCCHRSWELAER